jgi:TRAP-type C4-dicarboxylate transport system permease small subunit
VRVLIEVLHILAGIFAAMLIASLAAWSYPLAKHDIWWVAYAAMVAVVLMGVGPIRRAWAEDRKAAAAAPDPQDGANG